jgi:CRISPR-associated protein Cas8b1/Cst1 subtype I-B
MVVIKNNKITGFIGFLLVNILVASCDYGRNKNTELQHLGAEERKLIESYKKHFAPENWKKIEESLQETKKTKDWDKRINGMQDIKNGLESNDQNVVHINLLAFNLIYEFLIPGFSADVNKAKEILSDYLPLVNNLKKQADLEAKGNK